MLLCNHPLHLNAHTACPSPTRWRKVNSYTWICGNNLSVGIRHPLVHLRPSYSFHLITIYALLFHGIAVFIAASPQKLTHVKRPAAELWNDYFFSHLIFTFSSSMNRILNMNSKKECKMVQLRALSSSLLKRNVILLYLICCVHYIHDTFIWRLRSRLSTISHIFAFRKRNGGKSEWSLYCGLHCDYGSSHPMSSQSTK